MRKAILIVALVLVAAPAAALAAQPSHPATPANSHANSKANGTSTTGTSSKASAQAAKALFVLRGTLGAYTAANGTTNGSITITVKSSNHESATLKTMTLTFPVSSSTKVVGTVTSGHDGIVKVRAAKNATAAALQAVTATQVIDQSATETSGS